MFILDYRNGVKQKANSSDFFFLGCNLKNDKMISVHFQGKPFIIMVIQAYAPTSNAEEVEFERFYEDLLEKAMAPHSSTLAWKIS